MNTSHGTKAYLKVLEDSGTNSRKTFQTTFNSHAVWQAIEKLLKQLTCTHLETQVGKDQLLPCTQWFTKLQASTEDYWQQSRAWKKKCSLFLGWN